MTFVRALTSQRMWQLLVVSGLTLGLAPTAEARDTRSRPEIAPAIRYFEPVNGFAASTSLVRRGDRATRQLTVTFHTLGAEFTLDLEPNELFTPNARNVWVGSQVRQQRVRRNVLYKGTVRGELKSWARVRVRNGMMDGMIWTPEETYFIEPSARFFRGAPGGGMVAYRLSDTDSDWSHGSCALDDMRVGQAMQILAHQSGGAAASTELAQLATATLERADIGIIADYEYYLVHGANSASDMQSILNQVAGIYQSEVGVTLQVTKTVVFSTPSDPFSDTTDPGGLLNDLTTYLSGPNNHVAGTDLAHLFTGRDLDGNVIGIGYVGTLCNSVWGAGLSQDYTTDNKSLVLLTAHEIGHNFGASHDNQTGSVCASTPFVYIMNPYVSTSLNYQFSDCSKSYILPEIASAACLSSVSGPTPTPTATLVPTLTPTPTPTVPPAASRDAVFVTQSVPAQMVAGGSYPVSVTLTNTGTNTWTAASNYRLGSRNPQDNGVWGMARVGLAAGESIASGQQKTFTWTVTAPAVAGSYNFQWSMLQEGVAWFGALTSNVVVTVTGGALRDAVFVTQSVPAQMVAGGSYTVSVTLTNTGTNAWTAANYYRLGSQNPRDNGVWGMARVGLAAGESIASGQQKTFTWTVTAPAVVGSYNFQWCMLQEGVTWFGALTSNVVVTVTGGSSLPQDAGFVTQSVPAQMVAGGSYPVSVTFKNTGTNTWTAGSNYALGSQNPQDNWVWGMGRVGLTAGESIASGQQKTFTWTVTAPAVAGSYNFQWRMLQEGVAWFGAANANTLVTILP